MVRLTLFNHWPSGHDFLQQHRTFISFAFWKSVTHSSSQSLQPFKMFFTIVVTNLVNNYCFFWKIASHSEQYPNLNATHWFQNFYSISTKGWLSINPSCGSFLHVPSEMIRAKKIKRKLRFLFPNVGILTIDMKEKKGGRDLGHFCFYFMTNWKHTMEEWFQILCVKSHNVSFMNSNASLFFGAIETILASAEESIRYTWLIIKNAWLN